MSGAVSMKRRLRTLTDLALSAVIYWVIRALYATLRFSEAGRETVDALNAQKVPMVFALWHDELLPVVYTKRNLTMVAVISQSRDGEFVARFMERFGVVSARGSSSRGGVKALLQVSRIVRTQRLNGCLTVDGPRGPRHTVKEGAIFVAARAGALLVPVRLHMSHSYKFARAWDRFQVPLPFSRVHVIFDEPYQLPEHTELSRDFLEEQAAFLETRLKAL